MRRHFPLLLLVTLCASLAAAIGAMIVEPYYAHRLSALFGFEGKSHTVVAHGRMADAAFARRAGHGPAVALAFHGASTIEGLDVRAFGPGAVNHAVGGARLADAAGRIERFDRATPNIILLAGFNDLASGDGPTELNAQLTAILTARTPDQSLIVVGILPVAAGTAPGGVTNAQIEAANQTMGQTCRGARLCQFIDPMALTWAAADYVDDGVHLTPEGYRELQRMLKTALAEESP